MPVSVTCMVYSSDDFKFNWYKDGVEVRENKGRVAVINVGSVSTLVINKANLDDQGNYTCVARSPKSVLAYSATLKLRSAPKFLYEPQDTVLEYGKELVIIDCVVTANPPALISWYEDGGFSTISYDILVFNLII